MQGLKSMVLAAAVAGVAGAAQAAISYQRIDSPTAWSGTPTITTGANPTLFAAAQGDGTDVIGQSFYVTSDGKLSTIELTFGGCGGEDVTVALYDLGAGSATSNLFTSYTPASLTNLLTTTTAHINASGTTQNMLYSFTGADAVTLTGGHEYVFQFQGSGNSTLLRTGAGGVNYLPGMLFANGTPVSSWDPAGRDIGMAVTLTSVPEPASLALLGVSSLLVLRRRHA